MKLADITQLEVEYTPIDTAIALDFKAEVLDLYGQKPDDIIHVTDPFKVRATVTLTGAFRRMLGGRIAVQLNLENYGPGPEFRRGPQYLDLDPCGDGTYTFDFDVAAGELPADGLGTLYTAAFTFATQTLCGDDGPIHGWARELQFEIRP